MRTSIESARGCGYRKEGGLYLVGPVLDEPCPRLPLPVTSCPHCGQGIKPARGWTWVEPASIVPPAIHGSIDHNERCPLGLPARVHLDDALAIIDFGSRKPEPANWHQMGERAGLIWVGEKFYPTPLEFLEEASRMGVSRRIKTLPHGWEPGMWVILGHRKAILTFEPTEDPDVAEKVYSPGVITVFKPLRVEYIVKGDETDEQLAALEKRGIEPVKVVRDIDAQYVAQIMEDATGLVHWRSRPTTEREAEKMAEGAGINLDWDKFSVSVFLAQEVPGELAPGVVQG